MSDGKNDPVVTDEELQLIEKEVAQKEQEKEAERLEQAKKAAREELEAEQKRKSLEDQKAELEKKLEEQKKESEEKEKKNNELIDAMVKKKLEEEMTRRKGVVANNQPFGETARQAQREVTLESLGVNPQNRADPKIREIEELSRRAFDEAHGLPEPKIK